MEKQSTYILVLSVVFLSVIGIVMLSSTGAYASELLRYNDPYYAVKRQGIWLAAGIVACLLGASFDYRFWCRYWVLWYLIACVLLALCFTESYGLKINGANRWIHLGSLRFQPSELARLAVVVALASWFGRFCEKSGSWLHGFLLPLLLLLPPLVLITFEVDLGCAVLLGTTALTIMFVAGTRLTGLMAIGLSGLGALAWLIHVVPDRLNRVLAFRNLDDPAVQLGDGYQQWRALMAFGSGGFDGLGLGGSIQKMQYLPFAHTDFIMPIIGEELGLKISLLVVVAFVVMTVCGLLIASRAPDLYGKLLGVGIVCLIANQAVINLGVTTALLPNKGIPLPFVSYGGSNLVCCLAGVGILINIYRKGIATPRQTSVAMSRAKLTPRV